MPVTTRGRAKRGTIIPRFASFSALSKVKVLVIGEFECHRPGR